ncbi:MAG: hypothetical protein ACOX6H_02005 [Christensenellales bacterium]|jgi:hypothetical protein
MRPNLLKEKLSNVAILDKETVKEEKQLFEPQEQKDSLIVEKKAQKQESKAILREKSFFGSSLFADKSLFSEKTVISESTVKQAKQEIETHTQPEVEEEIQTESFDENFVVYKPKAKPKKREWKFRIKLITAVYVVVLGIATGWVISNAVRIAKTNSLLQASDIQYVQKLKDLEKLKEDQAKKESNVLSLEELINVTPLPLDDITSYEERSNWFDKIVNWFGNLFGG